jgi:putative ABC transport system ATP-binding protein
MIELTGLTKYFNRGGVNEVLALDRIDLRIAVGEFVTVIGSNGAGKSTLLNCLAGSVPIDEGRLLLDGADITAWPEHRRAALIGRVFQDPLTGTCGDLTIEQNLALAARRGLPRGLRVGVKAREQDFFRTQLTALELGLENRLKDKVGLLSGGQRQALTMAMATLRPPRILLLDEHTAALDPKTAAQILNLSRRMIETRNLTTLMVTHNMAHAIALGNRLIMLHRGRIILNVGGAQKAALTVEDLVAQFHARQGERFTADRALLGL